MILLDILDLVSYYSESLIVILVKGISSVSFGVEWVNEGSWVVSFGKFLIAENTFTKANIMSNTFDYILIKCSI